MSCLTLKHCKKLMIQLKHQKILKWVLITLYKMGTNKSCSRKEKTSKLHLFAITDVVSWTQLRMGTLLRLFLYLISISLFPPFLYHHVAPVSRIQIIKWRQLSKEKESRVEIIIRTKFSILPSMLRAIVLNCHIAKKNLQEHSYSTECQMTQNILSDMLK